MPTGSKGEKGEQVTRNVSYTDRLVRCELYDNGSFYRLFYPYKIPRLILILLLVQEEA